ncbi:hypothetical protein AC26_1771 [Escherichia coli 1-176-05_S3_C2]|nr:hypothetical protein AC26_1771 [Escherichia coli 1-176-05_S3_C2]
MQRFDNNLPGIFMPGLPFRPIIVQLHPIFTPSWWRNE